MMFLSFTVALLCVTMVLLWCCKVTAMVLRVCCFSVAMV